eukprot:TRINITY_DN3758_c0_g1_i1.p1 TRINITY_DN3758_c0_g1~~TRINITY_DN3758_c0_g1_i1.p1  ORF type:complete len:141 (-),score=50.50 TRINITY_DN3758_c0_g1_i1:112-510(-)
MSKQIIKIRVLGAKDLKKSGLPGKPNTKVIINLDGRVRETVVIKKDTSPTWNETFEFEYLPKDKFDDVFLHVEVKNSDLGFLDSKIGECKIPMKDYVDEKEQEEWFVLKKSEKSDKATGEVQLAFCMERINK